jgi:hypothetical protein
VENCAISDLNERRRFSALSFRDCCFCDDYVVVLGSALDEKCIIVTVNELAAFDRYRNRLDMSFDLQRELEEFELAIVNLDLSWFGLSRKS